MRSLLAFPILLLAIVLKTVASVTLVVSHVLAFWALKLMELVLLVSFGKEELERAKEMADKAGL